MSLAGILEPLRSFGSGALCVWLVARRHVITLAVYGWWTWTHGGGPGPDGLPVRRTSRTEWTRLLAAGVVGTLGPTTGQREDLASPLPEKR